MNDRHRIRLRCTCPREPLTIIVTGADNVEPHRAKLRALLLEIAAGDGWAGETCPTCRRWARGTEPATAPITEPTT